MSDTPETDAAYKNHAWDMHDHIPIEFSRKLERERDGALQLLRDIRADWGGLVVDDGCDCADCEFLRPIDALLNKYTTNQND